MVLKSFDIILIGATGFTGKRAARYLHENTPKNLTWGIAARNPQKLSEIAIELNIPSEHTFTVDTLNRKQVEDVVQKSKIILTTAGPFSLYGENVIAACAKYGTHYLDITGETDFIQQMMENYGELARKNKATIVPFSGFDSVPSDIAAYLLIQKFDSPNRLNIRSYYTIKGGVNGGTIASMLNKLASEESKEVNQPDVLLDGGTAHIHPPNHNNFFGFDRTINRWSTPFIMGPVNSKVVYKTAELRRKAGEPYAQSLAYSEHASLGKWYNPLPFITTSLTLISLTLFAPQKWFRLLLKKMMPNPGEGPSEKEIEEGFFKLIAIARDSEGNTEQLEMFYPGDPSNKSTVFFLCESALLLASLIDEKNNKLPYGFHTPMSAFGEMLPVRLKDNGLNIKMT